MMDLLKQVEGLLDMPPGEKETVLRELRSHYDEIRLQLEEEDYSEEIAAEKAAARLGTATDIAFTLNREHCVSSWKTAILTAVPFLVVAISSILIRIIGSPHTWQSLANNPYDARIVAAAPAYGVAIGIIAVVFLYASILQFRAGRRPLWLPSWSAFGLILLHQSLASFHLGKWMTVLNTAAFVIIGIVVCWRVKRWRKEIVWWSVMLTVWLSAGMLWDFQTGAALFGGLVAGTVLIFASSIAVFQYHRYGSPLLASLFLITVFWMIGSPIGFHRDFDWWPALQSFLNHYGLIAVSLTQALTIAIFSRASTPDKKGRILAWSAAAFGVFSGDLLSPWFATGFSLWIPASIHEGNRKKELNELYSESSHDISALYSDVVKYIDGGRYRQD